VGLGLSWLAARLEYWQRLGSHYWTDMTSAAGQAGANKAQVNGYLNPDSAGGSCNDQGHLHQGMYRDCIWLDV
jgi:hypothetical protein